MSRIFNVLLRRCVNTLVTFKSTDTLVCRQERQKIQNPNTTKSKINPKSQIQIYLLDFEIGICLVVLVISGLGISIEIAVY